MPHPIKSTFSLLALHSTISYANRIHQGGWPLMPHPIKSTFSLLALHNTISSANSIHHGGLAFDAPSHQIYILSSSSAQHYIVCKQHTPRGGWPLMPHPIKSTFSLLALHNTISCANSIHHGGWPLMPYPIKSIFSLLALHNTISSANSIHHGGWPLMHHPIKSTFSLLALHSTISYANSIHQGRLAFDAPSHQIYILSSSTAQHSIVCKQHTPREAGL